jgi:hypothetical protein
VNPRLDKELRPSPHRAEGRSGRGTGLDYRVLDAHHDRTAGIAIADLGVDATCPADDDVRVVVRQGVPLTGCVPDLV